MAAGQHMKIIKSSETATSAALVATWIWAELLDLDGAVVERVGDSEIACIVPAGDPERLARRIRGVLSDSRFNGWQPL